MDGLRDQGCRASGLGFGFWGLGSLLSAALIRDDVTSIEL